MPSIRHIFAATDLSPPSLQAVDRGFLLARTTGARYTLMHALGLDALGPLANLLGDQAGDIARKVIERQRAAMVAMAGDSARNPGITPTILVEEGMATAAVPAYAAATDADLVIVGARGESTLRRFVLGSTASHLLRKSKCPVLVVKRPARAPYRRVLVAVDFSPGSELSLRMARELAPEAHILLHHVFDVPFEGMLKYAGVSEHEIHRYRAEARERAMQALLELAARVGLPRSEFVPIVHHGDAAHHILEEEAHARCDLIVMGKHGTHVTEELLLGSVTKRVLSESHGDLLVVVDGRGPHSPG